jgi:hypothetical protein
MVNGQQPKAGLREETGKMATEDKMRRAVVCGGRDIEETDERHRALFLKLKEHGITHVAHGACRRKVGGRWELCGGDAIADRVGNTMGLWVVQMPADWNQHGRSAGPRRNEELARWLRKGICFYFIGGRGTADMKRQARRYGAALMSVEPRAKGERE